MRQITASAAEVRRFLSGADREDALPALSGHKEANLVGGAGVETATWADDEGIVAHAVLGRHGEHVALEYAVASRVTASGEREVLTAAWAFALDRAEPDQVVVWAARRRQRAALESLGFQPVRRLLHMRRDGTRVRGARRRGPWRLRAWSPGRDDAAIVAINEAAFAGHPEQAGMTVRSFRADAKRLGTVPEDLVVVEDASGLAGFCWTRRVDEDEGEIYVVAVDPAMAGRGLGRLLVVGGLRRIGNTGARRASLWVDESNERAVRLYESLGFRRVAENVAYGPQPKR